jgi:hypothetical protein
VDREVALVAVDREVARVAVDQEVALVVVDREVARVAVDREVARVVLVEATEIVGEHVDSASYLELEEIEGGVVIRSY